jgi:DNA-binding CsgD family transcriptional regulator
MLKMNQRPKIFYSEGQKAMMWDRWQRGESLASIARLFDRNHSAIQGILSKSGGIRPAQRVRSRLALSLSEREQISRGVVAGRSMRSIGASLGRAPSTVSRELKRNGGLVERKTRYVMMAKVNGKDTTLGSCPKSSTHCLSKPLVFSFEPRCQGLCGSQKYTLISVANVKR